MNILEACKKLDILRGWNLCEEIDHGGHGIIYRLENIKDHSVAALKCIHIACENGVSRESYLSAQRQILTELDVLQQIKNIPGIVTIQDCAAISTPDGNEWCAFIRMELLKPLLKQLQESELTTREAIRLIRNIAFSLDQCHQKNIIHGDIKPENILKGATDYKLSDFGIATILTDPGLSMASVGTPDYRPPEYKKGQSPTPRGDLYSLGLLAYYLFNNGLLPEQTGFTVSDEQAAREKRYQLFRENQKFFAKPQFVPEPLGDVICKACALNENMRYQSVADFLQALENAENHIEEPLGKKLPYLRQFDGIKAEQGILLSTRKITDKLFENDCNENKLDDSDDDLITDKQMIEVLECNNNVENIPSSIKTETEQDVQKRKLSQTSKKIIILFSAVIIILLTGIVLMTVWHSNQISDSIKIEADAFSVHLTISDLETLKKYNISIAPTACLEQSTLIEFVEESLIVTGLVPHVSYTITVANVKNTKELVFTTKLSDESQWRPREQTVYSIPSGIEETLIDFDMYGILTKGGVDTNGEIILSNSQKQSNSYYLLCSAEYMSDAQIDNHKQMMTITLALDNGEVYRADQTIAAPYNNKNLYFIGSLDDILSCHYNRFGEQFYGNAILNMYINESLVGTLNVTLHNND